MTEARRRFMAGVAVAAAGVAAFVVGSSLTPDPVDPAGRSVAIGAPTVDSTEPPEGESVAETLSTTSLVPTTTTVPPRALSSSISDWDSTVTWATEGTDGPVLVRLRADVATAEVFELPPSAGQFEWNASATLVAYVDDRVLFVGPPGEAEPLAVDVQQPQWHESDPHRIAWTKIDGDVGSDVPTITTAALSDDGTLLEEGAPFAVPDEVVEGEITFWSLFTWGDAGYLLGRQTVETTQGDNETRADLMLLTAEGDVRRVVDGQVFYVGQGLVVINTPVDGVGGAFLVIEIDGDQRSVVFEPGMELIAMSPNGESWVAVGPGDTMTALDGDRTLRLPIAVIAAAWTVEGSRLAVVGEAAELWIIEVATGEVIASANVSVAGALWNLRVHAGAGGE